jgi:hypothetical protein
MLFQISQKAAHMGQLAWYDCGAETLCKQLLAKLFDLWVYF